MRARRQTTEPSRLIAYEDDRLLILNKPARMPSAPLPSRDDRSQKNAAALALEIAPNLPIAPDGLRPEATARLERGLLHRLDTDTSGLLAFAKTPSEMKRLISAWKTPAVHKIYRAICVDLRNEAQKKDFDLRAANLPLTLDFALARSGKSNRRMVSLRGNKTFTARGSRGKPLRALTRILEAKDVKKQATEAAHAPPLLDLALRIETGVMHQIRCQLADIGLPVLGDPIYGAKHAAAAPRLFLHAWRLELPQADGTPLRVEAPLPLLWHSSETQD